jgi:hypothetical protein
MWDTFFAKVPEFPANAPAVFLTAASSCDKDLVPKVKTFVQAGGRVIATTGLIEALGDKGFQDIDEIQVTARRVMATRFSSGRGGGAAPASEPDLNILLPQIRRSENDNRTFILQNFRPQPVSARVSIVRANRLQDLLTDQTLAGSEDRGGRGGRGGFGGLGISFRILTCLARQTVS